MKKFFPLFLVIWLVACAPSTPVAPAPTEEPLDISTINPGEAFAGLWMENVPYDIQWFSVESLPTDLNVVAAIRPDGGLDLRVDGKPMPIWSNNGQWVMSNGINGSIVDFANGNLGAAGFKDGTIAFVRQFDGEWEIGLVRK